MDLDAVRPWHWPQQQVFPYRNLPLYARESHGYDLPHDHDFVEIALVTGGQAWHRTAWGRTSLSTGDVIVLRPGVWHAYEESKGLKLYNCCFSASLLERELAWLKDDPAVGALLWTGPFMDGRRGILMFQIAPPVVRRGLALLRMITRRMHHPLPAHRVSTIATLMTYVELLAQSLPVELTARDGEGARPTGTPRVVPTAVARVMEMIEGDLTREWSLDDFAEAVRLDSAYLSRLFKASRGLAPLQYLARCRAEHAARLLLRSDQSVKEIGQTVGWPSPDHFARRFRQHFGISATDYRHRFRPGAGTG